MDGMRFAVLGPIRAWREETELPLGPPQQRAVLAALLVHEGAQVALEGLVDGVWGDRAPASAVHVIHQYIHRLRLVLGREGLGRIRSAGGGYALDFDAESCDLTCFTRLVARARQARAEEDPVAAAALYAEGLALWRGPALAGVPGPYAAAQRSRLTELRLSAQEEHLAVVVDLGRYEQAAAELSVLAAAHPLRERLRELQMLALYGAGRQAEALEAFQETRRLLGEELGVDPGPGLQAVHQRILAVDPALLNPAPPGAAPAAAAPSSAPVESASPVPAQLPADVAHFTGRADQLEALTLLAGRTASTVVVSVIGGTAGVGKTALAVHWAHRNAALFPDGVLYVNLRGFDPAGAPLESAVAVHGFLDALGVASDRVPAGLEAQAGLYRSLLSGKRMLVMLDNARNADQIRPLLPGAAGCLVLVTSRDQLAGLAAVYGAHSLTLDLLAPHEARELLARRLGHARAQAEPETVEELIELCARLPLALNITAARANARPRFPLSVFAAELREARDRLAALDAGDPTANVRAVFSWSYRSLAEPAARMFRLLGVHPGPDITVAAAAALAAVDRDEARAALDELTRANLLIESVPGRFTFHDLLRAYAAGQVESHEANGEGLSALRRVVDFYTHTACRTEHVLAPYRDPIALGPPPPGVRPQQVPDAQAALAWFDAEYRGLLAAQQAAAANSWHTIVWQLAWSLYTVQIRRGHRLDHVAVWQAAMDAAVHLSEPGQSMLAHRRLGEALADLGRHAEAIELGYRALDLAEKHDDLRQQAETHHMLAWAWEHRGDRQAVEHALEHAKRALPLRRALGQRLQEAQSFNQIGWCLAQLGDYEAAQAHCETALAMQRRNHDPEGEESTLDSLAYIAGRNGRHRQAVEYYEQALRLLVELGHVRRTADTLDNLGHPHAALGEYERARKVWQEALSLYRQQGRDQSADRVQRELDSFDALDALDNVDNAEGADVFDDVPEGSAG
jgi:DNA-binding SARP family transcriptional activator/Tfp pilus assembly protein PilF